MRICPRCSKAFHDTNKTPLHICPHCGYSFTEGRAYKRVERILECIFLYKGFQKKAFTLNISRGGACIEYEGTPIPRGEELDLNLSPLSISVRARSVWSKAIGKGYSISGVSFLSTQEIPI